jgi:hypothetical protein
MEAPQPLVDTGGAGLSLLDAVLQQRARANGVVDKTSSRLLLAARRPAGAGGAEDGDAPVAELHLSALAEIEPDATGLVLVQERSFLSLVECSPEAAALLVRRLAREAAAAAAATAGGAPTRRRLTDARVVAMAEDCPQRLFAQLFVQRLPPPAAEPSPQAAAAAAAELEAEAPHEASAALFRAVLAFARGVAEAGAAPAQQAPLVEQLALGAAGGPAAAALCAAASDDRLAAFAGASKLTSLAQWLALFDAPLAVDSSAEASLPLPAKVLY